MRMIQIYNSWYQSLSLSKKLRYMMISLIIPLAICIIMIMLFLGWYVRKNLVITHNVNISSQFNIHFKESMDLKMYHYMVGSKEQLALPIEDVEQAIALAKDLQNTTTRKESKQAIRNMVDYCENLEEKMYNLEETKSYDSRKQQLEKNIYVLTNLIQEKMMDYIYYEAGYLAEIEKQMMGNIIRLVILVGMMVSLMILLILNRSFKFTKRITEPIGKLCESVNAVGMGNFEIEVVESKDFEIALLEDGIQQMAKQIKLLLEDVKEEEKRQHKTQLQLLQAQINPHFLYNTLDTIIWMVEAENNSQAIEMLTNLSVFFRTALSKGEDVISLNEEIRHTKSYLDIQQVRYRDILDYEIHLPKEMSEVKLPKLTLQPLVENALYHGVKEKRGQGMIKITCMEVEEGLCIVVEDNGIGMNQLQLEQVRGGLNGGEKVGFGLAAVQGRLKLYFGEAYGIRLDSVYGQGVRVEVLVPRNI